MQQLEVCKAGKRGARRTDPSFKHKLGENGKGETLKYCFQCGSCTAVCPISKFIGVYKPNAILELAKLGIRDLPQSSAFLFCSACTLCTKGCPQGVKVHEIMQTLKDLSPGDENVSGFIAEDFDNVLETLGSDMPFPVSYSWICLRPAEGEAGRVIQKAFDRVLNRPAVPIKPKADANVAIIGAGPAGLTAAWDLAKAGLKVTVFESLSEFGGMLRTGIPGYRLPKKIVDAEIEKIKAIGVEMHKSTPVDRNFFDDILKKYAAVFIATGAFKNRKLRLDGEELAGVVSALDYLREYNLTGKAQTGKKVVVIGGGNVATDAAGTAIRCGAESVKLFCLEDRKTMPAHEWEIDEIVSDGVEVNPSWGPQKIQGDGKKVTAVEFAFCKSVFDKDKKFNPVFDEKKHQLIEADTVITAIGQGPDLSFLNDSINTARGVVQVDPYTMETNLPNVFAGGDAVAGTASLIEAITAGKTAAKSIINYLNGVDA
jgi:NADPH-dependent glutamate synthase beta subunit-like oxidoreductase/ferredoxin